MAESIRIVSIQILLTSADIKLNSVTTLYYVSPACFVFLCAPFAFLEAPKLWAADASFNLNPAGICNYPATSSIRSLNIVVTNICQARSQLRHAMGTLVS